MASNEGQHHNSICKENVNYGSPTLLVSAVIVTYNRPNELLKCIDVLLGQTVPFCEIIIIDNSEDTDGVVRNILNNKLSLTPLRYFTNYTNSLTSARNIGVEKAIGDYIVLIDDDVILNNTYLEQLLNIFIDNPNIVGAQGYIQYAIRPAWRELFHRLFGLYHHRTNSCRVLHTGNVTYPQPLTKMIRCQWISGCNQMYKRQILQEIRWDEKLIKYSDGEDLDHSFRVYSKYKNGLVIAPSIPVIHLESKEGRSIGYDLILMREVYGWYLQNKLFPDSPFAVMAYLWSRLGRFLLTFGSDILHKRTWRQMTSRLLIKAYLFVWVDRLRIKRGDLSRFNSYIG